MLNDLFVKNFAIIDDLTINFKSGFTIISGESGAGKSIIIKALSLLTGDRADKSFIKTGEKNAVISAEFTNLNTKTKHFLEENLLGEECLIRRVIDSSGKSKVFINDNPTSLNLLKQLAVFLIDISSQNSHQLLLDNSHQMQILDDYADNADMLKNIIAVSSELTSITKQIHTIKNNNENNQNQLDFIAFQLREFEALNLKQDELNTIEEEYKVATKSKSLLENLNQVAENINNIEQELSNANNLLTSSKEIDKNLENAHQLLSNSQINITECNYEISNYLNNFSLENTEELEQKISVLYDLARKHHCTIEELLQVKGNLQHQIHTLENSSQNLAELEKNYQLNFEKYQDLCKKLTQNREKFALKLSTNITQVMQKFAMPYASFKIAVQTNTQKISPNGCDDIKFLINTRGDFKELKKIASGGELSRINLALAVLTSSNAYTPTLVFDEVDTGISGETATIVAGELKKLSENYQVLCITHLPQVASKSDNYILIENTNNMSNIKYLNANEKLTTIAKMMSGENITDNSLQLAKELIDD